MPPHRQFPASTPHGMNVSHAVMLLAGHAMLEAGRQVPENSDELRTEFFDQLPSAVPLLDERLTKGESTQMAVSAVALDRIQRAARDVQRLQRMEKAVAIFTPSCVELKWAEQLPRATVLRLDYEESEGIVMNDPWQVIDAGAFVCPAWRDGTGLWLPAPAIRILATRLTTKAARPLIIVKTSVDCVGRPGFDVAPAGWPLGEY